MVLKKKRVHIYDLKVGTKYFIDYLYKNYYIEYIGIFRKNIIKGGDNVCEFYNVSALYDMHYMGERNCYNANSVTGMRYMGETSFYNDIHRNYYELDQQKEKIQEAMKSRAVNKILQKITGDDTFKYNSSINIIL
jgi:hypothetical protein